MTQQDSRLRVPNIRCHQCLTSHFRHTWLASRAIPLMLIWHSVFIRVYILLLSVDRRQVVHSRICFDSLMMGCILLQVSQIPLSLFVGIKSYLLVSYFAILLRTSLGVKGWALATAIALWRVVNYLDGFKVLRKALH